MGIQVIIRDGRAGRDPALVTEAGGQILHQYDAQEVPPDIGDRIILPTGEEVEVVGLRGDVVGTNEGVITKYELTLFIDDIW